MMSASEPLRDRDVRLRALDGGPADGRVGIGVGQALLAPRLARADGRDDQPVRGHQIGQLLRIDGRGSRIASSTPS